MGELMPLLPGKKNISKNIKRLIAEGKSRSQAIAISLNVAGESREFNYENTRKKVRK